MKRKKFDGMKRGGGGIRINPHKHKQLNSKFHNLLVSAGICLPAAETAVAKTRPKSAITVKVNGMPMKANTYMAINYFDFSSFPFD